MLQGLARSRGLIMVASAAILHLNIASVASAEGEGASAPGLAALLAHLDRARMATQLVIDRIDRSELDLDMLQKKLGTDIGALFAFVRDKIGYEPYFGRLRGAEGALLARAANGLDRSLLLSALLTRAGYQVEIASGHLDDASAQRLLNRAGRLSAPPALAVDETFAAGLTQALGLSPEELASFSKTLAERADAADEALWTIVDDQASLLTKAFATAPFPTVTTDLKRQEAAAADHFWVRYRAGDGSWIDLDSAFPDSQPGKSYTAIAKAFPPDAVPDALQHWISIKVVLRVAGPDAGGAERTTDIDLIDQRFPLAERQEQGIRIENLANPSIVPALLENTDLRGAVDGVSEFVTILSVGDQKVLSPFFDLKGQTYSTPPSGPVGTASRLQNAQSGGLGGAAGALSNLLADQPTAVPGRRLVGQWIDITLTSPAGNDAPADTQQFHRDIVAPDIVTGWSSSGPAQGQRAAASHSDEELRRALHFQVDLLPVTAIWQPNFLGMLQAQSLQASIDAAAVMVRHDYGEEADLSGAQLPEYPLAGLALQDYVATQAQDAFEARYPALRLAVDRPGLIAFERRLTTDGTGFQQGYDIMSLGLRAAIRDPGSATDSDFAAATVMLGALATRAEWSLIERQHQATNPDGVVLPAIANVSELFRTAPDQGASARLLDADNQGTQAIAGLAVPDALKSELAEALQGGDILLAPVAAVDMGGQPAYGWWRFDSGTGQVLGVMSGGRGQATTEEAWLTWYSTKYLSGTTSGIVGLSTWFLCFVGAGMPTDATHNIACAVSGIAAAVGTFGYWPGGAAVSGISGVIGVIAAFIAMLK